MTERTPGIPTILKQQLVYLHDKKQQLVYSTCMTENQQTCIGLHVLQNQHML